MQKRGYQPETSKPRTLINPLHPSFFLLVGWFLNVLDIIGQLMNTTLVFSTALIFTALGGMYSERSGVVNIGLEGLMVSGAFAAAVATEYAIQAGLGSASPWIGFIAAAIYGTLFALLHAISTITFRADQTVVGVVINILSLGL